jgi:hypothetical protein
MLGGFGEAAKFSEACDQIEEIEDYDRCRAPQMVVDPFRRQYREVVGGQIDDALMISHVRVYLDKIAGAEDAQP